MNNNNFKGKVVFVTGAANGIGETTALAFAHEGASIIVADISDHGRQETVHMIKEVDGMALAVRCDVTKIEDVKTALTGPSKPLDILTLPSIMRVSNRIWR